MDQHIYRRVYPTHFHFNMSHQPNSYPHNLPIIDDDDEAYMIERLSKPVHTAAFNDSRENPIWEKWVKNGSNHLVVYLGTYDGSLDTELSNAGIHNDFLFTGKIKDTDETAVERNVDLMRYAFVRDGTYENVTYIGIGDTCFGIDLCVKLRAEPKPNIRTICLAKSFWNPMALALYGRKP